MSGRDTTQIAETVLSTFQELIEPYLERVGLEKSILADPDMEIPDRKFVELLELISKEQDDFIGIHMAMKLRSRNWGIFGHAVRNAPDVATFLNVMAGFVNVFSQAVEERFVETSDAIGLSYRLIDSSIGYRRQDSEFSITAIIIMLREATGMEIKAKQVRFEHSGSAGAKLYKEVFGVAPKFQQSINSIMFSRSVLAIPIVDADPRLYRLSMQYLKERLLERRVERSVIVRVSHIVGRKLADGVPTLAEVADAMHMSERTLQRRCREEGVDFLHLVDDIRRNTAIDHLKNSEKNLTDIASELGYSQLSAFSRAFRRWTGLTPMEYRNTYNKRML